VNYLRRQRTVNHGICLSITGLLLSAVASLGCGAQQPPRTIAASLAVLCDSKGGGHDTYAATKGLCDAIAFCNSGADEVWVSIGRDHLVLAGRNNSATAWVYRYEPTTKPQGPQPERSQGGRALVESDSWADEPVVCLLCGAPDEYDLRRVSCALTMPRLHDLSDIGSR
jgi:hypothetical protein